MTQLHDTNYRGFASDNYAGAHPEVLAAIADANGGHQISYGEDVYTARLQEVMKEHFGEQAEVFPVFNGTGANVTALTSVLPRWGAVIATSTAHIHTDENGAPERISGLKLLTIPTPDGKLTPELIDREAWGWGDEQLEAADPLGGAVFVSVDVRGGGCDDGTPAREDGCQRCDIRAGSVEDGKCLGLLAKVLLHDLLEAGCVDVLAVGNLVAAVGVGNRGEHLGVGPRIVVGSETAIIRVVELGHMTSLPFPGCSTPPLLAIV